MRRNRRERGHLGSRLSQGGSSAGKDRIALVGLGPPRSHGQGFPRENNGSAAVVVGDNLVVGIRRFDCYGHCIRCAHSETRFDHFAPSPMDFPTRGISRANNG